MSLDLREYVRDIPDFPRPGCAFIIELSFLGGRARLEPYDTYALVDYPR